MLGSAKCSDTYYISLHVKMGPRKRGCFVSPCATGNMHLVIESALLKRVFDALRDMLTSVNIDVTEHGLSIQALDPSNVSMCDLCILPSRFETFECPSPRVLGVNVATLSSILVPCGTTTLTCDADRLHVQCGEKTYSLKMINVDDQHLQVPDMDYDVYVDVPSKEFYKMCKDLAFMGESVTFKVGDTLVAETEGDMGALKCTVPATVCTEKKFSLKVSLQRTLQFVKPYTLNDTIRVGFLDGMPLMFHWRLTDGHLKFHLAPMVD